MSFAIILLPDDENYIKTKHLKKQILSSLIDENTDAVTLN